MRILLTISCLVLTLSTFAQISERPLPNLMKKERPLPDRANAPQATEALHLPFWDDFSSARHVPDPARWISGEHVRVSHGTGIEAPTLNVAVFDGVDVNGLPYDPTSLINGATDSLVSMPVDLGNLGTNQADSVFLSFFWQAKGNGELPDSEDSLVLQFKTPEGRWQTFWQQTGGMENENNAFEQELIQVPLAYFHSTFQFRFRAFSRLAGGFDTWLIDYIYLNSGRHTHDNAYPDRALTRRPSFLTGPYTAMPTEQFFSVPEKYLKATEVEFLNLNSSFQPIQYTVIVNDQATDTEVAVLHNETVVNPLPGAFERRILTSPALEASMLDTDADSLLLETTYYIKSGDGFFIENITATNDTVFNTQIDYRINDTVRVVTVIDDYLAYDDGEPDFAAGINQNGGKLAYQFFVEERALLTHIDINFPFTQQAGEPIELLVWEQLAGRTETVLFQNSYSVLRPDDIGTLSAYELDTPVYVQDTFYIGFQQATDEFLAVGLDKNNDTGDRMFFNVDGTWQPNQFVSGSFLMRPRFDKTIAAGFNPGGAAGEARLDVFPNPSTGRITISGSVESIRLFDAWGKASPYRVEERPHSILLDLSMNKKGIYLLKVLKNGKTLTRRIILNH